MQLQKAYKDVKPKNTTGDTTEPQMPSKNVVVFDRSDRNEWFRAKIIDMNLADKSAKVCGKTHFLSWNKLASHSEMTADFYETYF